MKWESAYEGHCWLPHNPAVAVSVTWTCWAGWELVISDVEHLLVQEWYRDREVARRRAEEFILDRLWREPGAFQ